MAEIPDPVKRDSVRIVEAVRAEVGRSDRTHNVLAIELPVSVLESCQKDRVLVGQTRIVL